jgi:hypothetical protein
MRVVPFIQVSPGFLEPAHQFAEERDLPWKSGWHGMKRLTPKQCEPLNFVALLKYALVGRLIQPRAEGAVAVIGILPFEIAALVVAHPHCWTRVLAES